MTAVQLQETFGIGREQWRHLATEPGMPEPIDPKYTDGKTKWSPYTFVHWLAARHPELAGATPILLRPAGAIQTRYAGGTYSHHVMREYFTARWATGHGTVAIVYPRHDNPSPETLLEAHKHDHTVVVVRSDWNLWGLPDLEAVDRERPKLVYDVDWSELSAHIGTAVPWWPSALRREQDLLAWRPGAERIPVEPTDAPGWDGLLDLGLTEAKGSALRAACLHLAHRIRSGRVEHALWEIEHMDELAAEPKDADREQYLERQQLERSCMLVAAVPAPDPASAAEAEADEQAVRAGAAELCRRGDDLALRALNELEAYTGDYRIYGGSFSLTVTRATRQGREWIERLLPSKGTVLHRFLEEDDADPIDRLIDPVTGIPVVRKRGHFMFADPDEISYHSYCLRALPAGSRLAEVVLDDPVWVRCEDGVLYPAPSLDAPGVAWGYTGSGPGTLATLIGKLLEDGGANAVAYHEDDQDEPNLEAFLQVKHPRGTRLRRRALENVRERGAAGLGLRDKVRYSRRDKRD